MMSTVIAVFRVLPITLRGATSNTRRCGGGDPDSTTVASGGGFVTVIEGGRACCSASLRMLDDELCTELESSY